MFTFQLASLVAGMPRNTINATLPALKVTCLIGLKCDGYLPSNWTAEKQPLATYLLSSESANGLVAAN